MKTAAGRIPNAAVLQPTIARRWEKNLAFLRDHATEASANAVRRAAAEAGGPRLTMTHDRRGNPQYRAGAGAESGTPLHSARDPEGEARRQVEHWLQDEPIPPGRIVVVFGLAGAFHLRALVEALDSTNGLLVVDVTPTVVADILHHIDISELEHTSLKTLRFILGADAERVFAEFYSALAQWPRLDYSFFIHPGTRRAFADTYDALSHRFAERVRMDILQRATIRNLTRGWLTNALRNLPNLIDSTPIDALKGRFRDRPAAVVAAGPTLEQSLDLLRDLADRMLIIAVGTAYRPLRAAGIDPHLVVLVDGSPLIAKQFEQVRTDAGRLVIPPQIDPGVVALFAGRIVAWESGALPEFRDWLEDYGQAPADTLGAGGTVTYSAIDAARYLGCPRIFTFGLDLAYRDDGRTHAGNTMYDGNRGQRAALVPVPGNLRPEVWTTRQFATYIELLAGLAASLADNPDCDLVNVNPDGARIPNMAHCLPADVCADAFPVQPCAHARLDRLCGGGRLAPESLTDLLDRTESNLDDLESDATEAATLCRGLASGKPITERKARRMLDRLQELEARLGAPSPGSLLLSAAVRASSMETVAFCAGIGDRDETGFRRVHEKCAEYYTGLATMIGWLRDELDHVRVCSLSVPPRTAEET